MKIRVRLGVGFAFVAMLLVSISTVSFLRLSVINADISDRLNDKFPKTVWANDVINNVIARDELLQGRLRTTPNSSNCCQAPSKTGCLPRQLHEDVAFRVLGAATPHGLTHAIKAVGHSMKVLRHQPGSESGWVLTRRNGLQGNH